MKEPWFWRDQSMAARTMRALLTPVSALYDAGQKTRAAMARPQGAGAPVICIGAASLGGAGKTPFALMLCEKLKTRGRNAHFATRGYGGAREGPLRVNETHSAGDVGDEALLLASAAPAFVAKNRLAGVRAAAADADLVIMDDGFQNPTVRKNYSILLLSGSDIGASVFPAGPMREPLSRAIGRADAIVVTDDGKVANIDKPVFRATTRISESPAPQRVIAFSGIANPARFFKSLDEAGLTLVERIAFSDHHMYSPADLSTLKARAAKENAALITTEKDLVRLSPEMRSDILTLKIRTDLDDSDGLIDLILEKIGSKN